MASAAELGISHADAVALERQWDLLEQRTRNRIRCAGTRGRCRTWIEALRVFRSTIPPDVRTGRASSVSSFLRGKDWSHIIPRSMGGSDLASNGRWEPAAVNRLRGARLMAAGEIAAADRAAASAGLQARVRTLLTTVTPAAGASSSSAHVRTLAGHGVRGYAPPFADPEEVLSFIERQLRP